jgi:hypothetical protein
MPEIEPRAGREGTKTARNKEVKKSTANSFWPSTVIEDEISHALIPALKLRTAYKNHCSSDHVEMKILYSHSKSSGMLYKC